jgi:hypothetical protein
MLEADFEFLLDEAEEDVSAARLEVTCDIGL